MSKVELETIKVYPSHELDNNTMMFELFQRLAYEYWISIEEGMYEAIKKDNEKMLWEKKKIMTKPQYRRVEKEVKENEKRYLARTKAFRTKVEDMQKIFERGNGVRNDNMENAVEKMYDVIDKLFEHKL